MFLPPSFRQSLACSCAAVIGLSLVFQHAVADNDSERPNFLFVAVDDLNDFSGYSANEPGNFLQTIYPDADVRAAVTRRLTPNLNQLAKQSAPFVRAYCPSALCGPSRTSLMTGVAPFRSGYYTHSRHFRTYDSLKDAVTLPQQLKRHGYFTTGLGKLFHKPVGNAKGPLKDDWADARHSWSVWINHATGCNGGKPGKYSPPDGGNMVFGPSRLSLRQSGDWLAADFAARLLETGTATVSKGGARGKVGPTSTSLPDDQPFFLGCGLFRPHLPFHAPQRFFDLFPTEKMSGLNRESMDEIYEDLKDLPEGAKRFTDIRNGKFRVIIDHARSLGDSEEEIAAWRSMVQSYLACVAYADACLGRLFEGYKSSPKYDNTVLVLWSDHGYHMGSKFHVAKQALWEEANRVQLIIHDPRAKTGMDGRPRRQIVSLNDLYPTICELAGVDVADQCEVGRSLTPAMKDPQATIHEHLLMTYMEGNHSLRTQTHRLNRYRDGSIELYDMVNDPRQLKNLATNDQSARIRERMLSTLASVLGDDETLTSESFSPEQQKQTVSKRPNVLLIITDDQNDYYAAASGVHAKTPALARLKSQSIEFTRAYCASPVCGPSRAALFSGLYPHRTGAYLNGADPWRTSEELLAAETLPELFQRGGYETWGMGKLFHAKLPDSRTDKQWNNRASANGGFGPFGDAEHQLSGKFFSVQEWDGPDTDFPDVKSANAAIEFLSNRQSDQPFLMVYGLWRPHNPWTAPRRFFDQYDVETLPFPPPGYSASDLDDVPEGGQRLADIYKERWKKHGDQNQEDWRRVFHGYLACTSFADWNLGRVIDALDKTAFSKDTYVIVTADNGYHVGEKSHYGKSTLWEKSARVPLFIRVPDRLNGNKRCEATVGLLDLYPTLRSLCKLPPPKQALDGRDITRLFRAPSIAWPHSVMTTYGEGKFSLRFENYRYIRYPNGSEELYDHDTDPHEFHNLADEPSTLPLRKSFRAKIPKVWARSIGGRNG
ncbi:MAG: sulfatase [Planctomycetota bacterium]